MKNEQFSSAVVKVVHAYCGSVSRESMQFIHSYDARYFMRFTLASFPSVAAQKMICMPDMPFVLIS